jgi:NAD(P)-dependent dehydrogenase (short-subunit alcohol dehydrogenase family)
VHALQIGPRTVCVVTGASSGVGRALARTLADRGAAVGLLARGEEGLAAAAVEVEARGGRALALPADVADSAAVDQAADRAEADLGPIDAWFNVAMATVFAPFWEIEPAEFRRATDVTYLGVVHGTMAALRRMRPRDRGVIVQTGSALAYRAIPLQSPYCGAKHAIRGFTNSLRAELLHERSSVRIVSVHLPAHNTPQFDLVRSKLPRRARPVAPVYRPEVAARAIVHAAEHARRELWAGHTTTAAILVNRLAPGLLDHYLARTAFEAQQTPEPEGERADYLFEPIDGDHGAHGRFGPEARERSLLLELTLRRRAVLAGAALAGAGGLALARLRSADW